MGMLYRRSLMLLCRTVMLDSQRLTPPPTHSTDQKTSCDHGDELEQHVLHGGLRDDLASMSGMAVSIMIIMTMVMFVIVIMIMIVITVWAVLMIAHLTICSCRSKRQEPSEWEIYMRSRPIRPQPER